MRILHVYKDFDPPIQGGMERHIALMCRFQRQWAEVEALVCSRSWRTRVANREGTRVTEVGEWGRFQSAPFSPLFPWHMRIHRADVIVVHVPNPTAELGYLLARPRGRLVVRYHSDVVRQATAMRFYASIQVKFLSKAAMILPTSELYAASSPALRALREYAPGARVRVVPLGILPEEFEEPNQVRVEALRLAYGGRYVLFSGRHRYYKGLEYLVKAASSIKASVVVAGDGPERKNVEALAHAIGAPVRFVGSLTHDELVAHLHGCEVFVFPSVERSEAFGLSILEAHASGRPVVATRLGTGVEVANLDGVTGLNVPPRDPQLLAEAVNRLLEDDVLRNGMGERARERVKREFHAERAARAEFDLFREAISL